MAALQRRYADYMLKLEMQSDQQSNIGNPNASVPSARRINRAAGLSGTSCRLGGFRLHVLGRIPASDALV